MNRIILVGRNRDFPRFTPRSGSKPAPGGAADLRQSSQTAARWEGTQSRSPTVCWWRDAVIDAATVVAGLAVFGAIAFFFMVIA